MKTETKSFAEYKAPKCKVVEVHVEAIVCQSQLETWENEDI